VVRLKIDSIQSPC